MNKVSNWYRVDVTVNDEAVEPMCGGLFELSPSGFQIEPAGNGGYSSQGQATHKETCETQAPQTQVSDGQATQSMSTITFYLPQDASLEDVRTRISSITVELIRLGFDMTGTKVDFTLISDEDWAENYKQFFNTVRIGHVLIKPSWEDEDTLPGDVVVQLDPGLAFGTGSHPTTEGCILLMQDVIKGGETVLDVGTGSGILAIAAVKLGAARVIAIDNDPIAIDVARENAMENGVDKDIDLRVSEIATLGRIQAEVVVANITAPVIVSIIPDIINNVSGLKDMIVAGIMGEQKDFVVDALVKNGFSITRTFEKNNWVSMIAAYDVTQGEVTRSGVSNG
jgi:ribosomal protein L11 methyltransferase